jgi:Ca2+-binding EF-hand superfamily protein
MAASQLTTGSPHAQMKEQSTGFHISNEELRRSRKEFEGAHQFRNSTNQITTRYSSTAHNMLRGTDRLVARESIKLANIGADGLHRYDVQPQLDHYQPGLDTYYKADLKAKRGTTKIKEPIFTVKGLHNHSSIPSGDTRITRCSSNYRETFSDPSTRPPANPRYDHLQDDEPVNFDGNIGPVNTVIATDGPLGKAEADLKEKRRRYYRACVESVDVQLVDEMERELRDNLNQTASGAPKAGTYYLRSTFRFFDRDARGAINLDQFRTALETLGLNYPPDLLIALFARYDTKLRGFIDYYEMVQFLLGKDYESAKEKYVVSQQVSKMIKSIRSTSKFVVPESTEADEIDVHAMDDAAFARRQRVRKIFRSIDVDGSGFIEYEELQRLLILLGIRVSPYEMQLIFNLIDCNESGQINFEEFYCWYITASPMNSTMGNKEVNLARTDSMTGSSRNRFR